MVVQGADVGPVFARRHCRTEPASSHSERRSSSSLAPPPAKQVPDGFSMLTATCMQRGEIRAAGMMVQGAAVGPVSPAAAAALSPPLATASAVAQAHWRRRPQNKSSTSLVIGSCIGVPTGLDCARCSPRWPAITLRPAARQGLLPPAPSGGIGPTA